MVRVVQDSPYKISGCRHITLEYNINNKADMDIFKKLMAVLDKQPLCQNCDKYYIDSQYCGYSASMCMVNGCLDGNPQHDFDGSKCKYYARKQGGGVMLTKEIKEYGKSIDDSVYLSFDMSYRDSSEFKIIALKENVYSTTKVSAFDDDDTIRRKVVDVIKNAVSTYNNIFGKKSDLLILDEFVGVPSGDLEKHVVPTRRDGG